MICIKVGRRQTRHHAGQAITRGRLRSWSRPVAAALALVGLLSLVGCGGSEVAVPPQAVYFDTASKQVMVLPASGEYPALHPATGQPTLVPAMHCPQCVAWRQAPPPEQLNRAAASARCPRCKTPLQLDGPLPAAPEAER